MSPSDQTLYARLQPLKEVIEEADCVLDGASYSDIRGLFLDVGSDQRLRTDLKAVAPEFGKQEFLLVVDREGTPIQAPQPTIDDFRVTTRQFRDFGGWFQAMSLETQTEQTLLIARWLSHLLGFRHRTIHLFIDIPPLENHTLVQVRGLHKAEFPGCFDLPVAGHVVGLDSPMQALFQELGEELNLGRDDISDPEEIGSYSYRDLSGDPYWRNVEHRSVFASRLEPRKLPGIRFVDQEVAAIAIFRLSELKAMIDTFPERVASGLKHSFPLYLEGRTPAN